MYVLSWRINCWSSIGKNNIQGKKRSGAWSIELYGAESQALGYGLLGGLVGFTVGGFLGSLAGKDEIYSLTNRKHNSRKMDDFLNIFLPNDIKK